MINLKIPASNPPLKEKEDRKNLIKDDKKQSKEFIQGPKKLEQKLDLENVDLKLKLKNLQNQIINSINPDKLDKQSLLRPQPKLSISLNVANDLKALLNEIKDNKKYIDILQKLEKSLIPAKESLKPINTEELFKNSGVFFESKLKQSLKALKLPPSFFKLNSTIKGLNDPLLSSDIKTLSEQKLSLKDSLEAFEMILKHHKDLNAPTLEKSAFKALFKLSKELNNFKLFINTIPNIDKKSLKKIVDKIASKLSQMSEEISKEIRRPQNIALEDTSVLKRLNEALKGLNTTVKELKNFENKKASFEKILKQENIENTSPKTEQKEIKQSLKESQRQDFLKNPSKEKLKALLSKDEKINIKSLKENVDKSDIKTRLAKDLSLLKNNEKLIKEEKNSQKLINKNANIKEESVEKNLLSELSKNIKKEKPLELAALRKPRKAAKNINKSLKNEESIKIKENEKNLLKKDLEIAKNKLNASEKAAIVEANIAKLKPAKTMNEEANIKNQNPLKSEVEKLAKELALKIVKELSKDELKGLDELKNELKDPKELIKNELKNLSFKEDESGKLMSLLDKDLSHTHTRVKEALNALDKEAVEAQNKLADINQLGKNLAKLIKEKDDIAPASKQEIEKSLQDDIKPALITLARLAKDGADESVLNQANKLLAQVELNQLLSLANNSINTFMPFFWDDLKGSNVVFKRGKKNKYFASINLDFVKLGSLNILLSLNNDKYIDINMMIEDDDFRKKIYKNAQILKKSLSKAGLLPSNFFVSKIPKAPFLQSLIYDEMSVDLDKSV